MSERIVSPGVFTNEKDQSFLTSGVSEIGAAVVGSTQKGPAGIPTKIFKFSEFEDIFGSYTEDSYVPLVVNDYLKNAGVCTIVRLLYEDGYQYNNGVLAIIANDQDALVTTADELLTSFTSVSASAGSWTAGLTGSLSGTGAVASVTLDTTGSISAVTVTSGGSGYTIGETVTCSTGSLGFFSGSLTFTLAAGDITDNKYVTHILHPTTPIQQTTENLFEASTLSDLGSGSFALTISGSFMNHLNTDVPGFAGAFEVANGVGITASIDTTNNAYITKTYGKGAKSVDYPVYVHYENRGALDLYTNQGDVSVELDVMPAYVFLEDYLVSSTPWVKCQKIGGLNKNLFKFHSLSHGTNVNWETKVSISNIKIASEVSDPNGYGTFTVELRKVNTTNLPPSCPYDSSDTDKAKDIIQTWENVNLDPKSPNYIEKKIGTQYRTIDSTGKVFDHGDFKNNSNYIRVEVASGVSAATNDKELIPFGFAAPTSPISNASSSINLEGATYITSQVVGGAFSNKYYFGFDFTDVHNLNYLSPLPSSGSTVGNTAAFDLGTINQDAGSAFPSLTAPYSGSLQTALDAGTFTANVSQYTRQFIMPMQGGFDGARPNLPKFAGTNITAGNTFGFDCMSDSSTGTKSYKKAFSALSNTDYYDINMLVTPGILHKIHPIVTAGARDLVETRQDAFYVMDTNELTDSILTTINTITSVDSNYTATYYPWLRVLEPSINKDIWVPPGVVIPGALSFNDAVGAPWYAPAGLVRGGISPPVIDVYDKLSQSDRDDLYSARINPIANFPAEGICIWGQKTLQAKASALDRVNVRRLLITVKKFIASATRYLVFEQNTSATRTRFLNIANPYLETVRAQQGLYAFRVIMDSTNNTPDIIDQNILYGQIFLQPTRTAEFIILDFNIQPTGAAFPE